MTGCDCLPHINCNDDREHYALNSQIAPPHTDDQAILQPGEWKPIHTFEGHMFRARESLPDRALGDDLMQHTVGMVPIGSIANPALVAECANAANNNDSAPHANNAAFQWT